MHVCVRVHECDTHVYMYYTSMCVCVCIHTYVLVCLSVCQRFVSTICYCVSQCVRPCMMLVCQCAPTCVSLLCVLYVCLWWVGLDCVFFEKGRTAAEGRQPITTGFSSPLFKPFLISFFSALSAVMVYFRSLTGRFALLLLRPPLLVFINRGFSLVRNNLDG